jgi:synaptic vesicle membrane protein VAT-1
LISQSLFNIRSGVLRLANENKSVMAFNLSYLFDEVSLLDRIMRNLLTDFDQGRLVPLPTRCFPFEQAGLAHRDVPSGLTIGKCEPSKAPIWWAGW